jgi:hypothetical protein
MADALLHRESELEALAGILPFDARERLATLLTDDDVATLKHLARTGMGANTLRALASDLGYLEAWCRAAMGEALPWPAPVALPLKFVAHHLWDPAERETDPNHGMPQAVIDELRGLKLLRVEGPACGCDRAAPPRPLVDPASLPRPRRTAARRCRSPPGPAAARVAARANGP